MRVISASRLVLRNLKTSDAIHMHNYLAYPLSNCFLSEKIGAVEEAAKVAIEKSNDDSFVAICLKDMDRIIGELLNEYEEPDTYSIGWILGNGYGGKGYAKESSSAFFDYLFEEKMARRLYAYLEEDNY